MADRRISKIKSVWGNGLAGKIIVVVVAGVVLSLIGSIIAVPVIYETKADANIKQVECKEIVDKVEKRTCEKLNRIESKFDVELERDREWMKSIQTQLSNNSKVLERLDERTIRMDEKIK